MSAMALQISFQIAKNQANVAAASVGYLHTASYSTDVRVIRNPSLSSLKRGTGGRSSFNGIVATVFGNTGFLGRYVCNKLGKIGTQLILPYRCDEYDVLRLKLVGDLGQVLFNQIDPRDDAAIRDSMKYSNCVINLIGRDWETKNYSYHDVHVDLPKRIAQAAKDLGIPKLIHVSHLNASPNPEPCLLKGGSNFLKAKYEGENAVREIFPDAVIIRPGVIYGSEDRFLKLYSHVWRRQLRYMPLWKKGEATVKQPVYVSDVAAGIVAAAKDPSTNGKVFQAVGPKRYLLSELVDWFFRIMRRDANWGYIRYDTKYDPTLMLKAQLTNLICPGWPVGYVHPEGLELEHVSDIVREDLPTLEDLGVQLTKMENQVPWELRPYRYGQYYDEELGEFEHPAPPVSL